MCYVFYYIMDYVFIYEELLKLLYYKPIAPALCWCNRPGSAPSHRAGLEPGFPAREAGALTRNAKDYSL